MPISLELVNFTEAFRIQHVKTIAQSFERLGQWLTKRVKQADELERATNRIPVVWFYNEAVTLWINASQKDALAPQEPPPSFGDHLKAGGGRFVAGLKDVVELPREALIIPRFFDAVLAGVDEIVKSIERFHKPTTSMFDTEARTASDLFGEAALAFRAIYWSKDQLRDFRATLYMLKGPPKQNGGPAESVNALPDLFERVTRYIVAGLYLVTWLPEFVKRVWKEASLFIRAKVLDVFAGIEEQVFGVRRQVIDIFYVDLRASLRKGLAFALAWSSVSTAWVALFLDVSERFGTQIFTRFGDFFAKLSAFIKKLVGVFHGLEWLLNKLLKIDLMKLLVPKLEGHWWWSVASRVAAVPTLPIGDLAENQTRAAANLRMQSWLSRIQRRVRIAAGPLGGGVNAIIRHYLKPVRKILNIALATQTALPAETGAFAGPLPEFPDVSDTFTVWLQPLREALADFVPSLQTQTRELIDKGTEVLDALSSISTAPRRALCAAPPREVSGDLQCRGAMAEKAFPASDVVDDEPNAVVGALARSWENWLVRDAQGARAGFEVIGAIIPEYIAAMRAYWAERQTRGEEATRAAAGGTAEGFPDVAAHHGAAAGAGAYVSAARDHRRHWPCTRRGARAARGRCVPRSRPGGASQRIGKAGLDPGRSGGVRWAKTT